MIVSAIRKVTAGESLTRAEARAAANLLMDGVATPAQIGALLVGLRMKGETVEEVTGFALALRTRAAHVVTHRKPLLDTCGTGGSAFRVFNVSTAAAFVVSAAGVAVAKHGNRSVSGVCGSADVLEALGVRLDLSAAHVGACLDALGIGFLFAPAHHPAMREVSSPRREIGIRTLFNLVGPLTNPANAAYQLMGVYDSHLCELAAGTLRELGSERAMVVHGEIGLDEISTIGPTRVCELRNGTISDYTLTRRDFGLDSAEPDTLSLAAGATPAENAFLLRGSLTPNQNDRATLARQELVAVNAGAALLLHGIVDSWQAGAEQAMRIVSSGAALEKLEALIQFTQSGTASGL